jgi:hypothetical protein
MKSKGGFQKLLSLSSSGMPSRASRSSPTTTTRNCRRAQRLGDSLILSDVSGRSLHDPSPQLAGLASCLSTTKLIEKQSHSQSDFRLLPLNQKVVPLQLASRIDAVHALAASSVLMQQAKINCSKKKNLFVAENFMLLVIRTKSRVQRL